MIGVPAKIVALNGLMINESGVTIYDTALLHDSIDVKIDISIGIKKFEILLLDCHYHLKIN